MSLRVLGAAGLALALSATSTTADPVTAFEACIGPEMDRRIEVILVTRPCERSNNCGEIDREAYRGAVEVGCAGHAIDACAVSTEADACLAGLSSTMAEFVATDLLSASPERIAEAGALPGHPRADALLKHKARATGATPIDCPAEFRTLASRLEIEDENFCTAFSYSYRFTEARSLVRRVSRKEEKAN